MFNNTINAKPLYTNNEDEELVDLGESIFNTFNIFAKQALSMIKVSDDMEMRADKIAIGAYGDEEFTELLLKYNNIHNPFTIKKDDIMIVPSMTYIKENITRTVEEQKANQDALIRNFHKFIDKNKIPKTVGSEKNNTIIPDSVGNIKAIVNKYKEANMADEGASSIKELNGKLYFGADSGMKCAMDGISTTDYLNTVIKNSNNK